MRGGDLFKAHSPIAKESIGAFQLRVLVKNLRQARPGSSLPQVFDEDAQLKGAYRFFSNRAVSFEQIAAPHWQRTRQSLTEPGDYLLIEDSTDLDYSSHQHCRDLGRIGNDRGRGLLLHTTLAVQVKAWDLDHPE